MYLSRTIEQSIRKFTEFFPVLLLTGPRQVGKTTVFQACAGERAYVSLDDMGARALAKSDPALFLQRYKPPVLIDEIQYAPELFPAIKEIVDRRRQNGLFWLTGSQQFHLMRNVSESLAGRVGILQLAPLSQTEQRGEPEHSPFLPTPDYIGRRSALAPVDDLMTVYQRIRMGGYPRLFSAGDDAWQIFYSSYLQTYIERDLRTLGNIGDELRFLSFIKSLAARTGQLLNYSDLARDIGVSSATVKTWISVLNSTGLIFLLPPYFNNINNRVVKTPKLYFMDTGLACYLTGWNSAQTLEAGAMSGAMLETFVVSEVVKSYLHNGRQAPVYFYRDKDKREIDLLIEENGLLYPVEVKKKSGPGPEDVRAFACIDTVLHRKRGPGAVLCLAASHMPINREVTAVPVSYI